MVRQVKPEEYAARRAEILSVALNLIREKGYQQMTIADVLTALGISKGAFYHYFDSKGALLDGITELMTADVSAVLRPVVSDPSLDALSKLRKYLTSAADWKAAHDDELTAIARMWRDENNAVLKQKVSTASVQLQAPLIAAIIRQGCAEGVFNTTHPDEAAVIIVGMGLHLADALIDAFTAPAEQATTHDRRETLVRAHLEALERILDARPHSLTAVAHRIVGDAVAG